MFEGAPVGPTGPTMFEGAPVGPTGPTGPTGPATVLYSNLPVVVFTVTTVV